MNSHLSDDELIGLLYGLGNPEGHIAGCSECDERWNAMRTALGMVKVEAAPAAPPPPVAPATPAAAGRGRA